MEYVTAEWSVVRATIQGSLPGNGASHQLRLRLSSSEPDTDSPSVYLDAEAVSQLHRVLSGYLAFIRLRAIQREEGASDVQSG